jgi:hypothetical protein
MSKHRPSLMEFMRDKNMIGHQPSASQEDLRRQIESGELVRDLERTAKQINQAAGTLMIDAHSFLWPEPLVRSFALQKGREEHRMQLELWNDRLVLRFVTHRARASAFSRYLPWVFAHWFGFHEVDITMNSSTHISAERVHARDVESWFVYLLSGFDRALIPAFATDEERELVGARVSDVGVRKALALD